MQLFCQLDVDTSAFGKGFGIDFDRYFQEELLKRLELKRLTAEQQGKTLKPARRIGLDGFPVSADDEP